MRCSVVAIAMLAAVAAAPALAQTGGGGGGGGSGGGGGGGGGGSTGGSTGGSVTTGGSGGSQWMTFDQERARMWREQQAERKRQEREVLAATPADRKARADRVAAVLNRGDCGGAAKLALDEGDAEMARNVAQLCRPAKKR